MNIYDALDSRLKTTLHNFFGDNRAGAEFHRAGNDGDMTVAFHTLLGRVRSAGIILNGDIMLNPTTPRVLGEFEAEWTEELKKSGSIRTWSMKHLDQVPEDVRTAELVMNPADDGYGGE